jgi:TRAP-type C4-dicarboxylate transport system permease small subunit
MIRVLLVVVAVMAVAVPFFNSQTPVIFGIPFFFAYQLAIVPLGGALIFIVYLVEAAEARKTGR